MTPSVPGSRAHGRRAAPALTLLVVAPLLAEVLPGATRFSSLFVFPIEMCVWGGGALRIRDAVRRWRLGWLNMLLLAFALAVAEECLIQQTSLAPMVLHLRGAVYARALGLNYVYLLWALVYEAVFVVLLPVALVELIFPERAEDTWISRGGLVAVISAFLAGSGMAWYTWTRFVRPNVFHAPIYTPPPEAIRMAWLAIGVLVFSALGPFRQAVAAQSAGPRTVPPYSLLAVAGALWATLWYGLVLLAFGIAPSFPPSVAVVAGILLGGGILLLLPRWTVGQRGHRSHGFAMIFGTMLGSMLAGFAGFLGAARMDLLSRSSSTSSPSGS